MIRGSLSVLLFALFIGVSGFAVGTDPGMGPGYSTIASGPLAPLWNPAGAVDSPGVHGAFAVTLSGTEEPLFLVGASISAEDSPTVCWSMSSEGTDQETRGTFAFPIFTGTSAGIGVAYASGTLTGISFHAGVLYRGAQWAFGGSIVHIASGLFGGDIPIKLRVGTALLAIPGAILAANFSLSEGKVLVTIDGEARLWLIDVRWGLSLVPTGGIDRLGMGIGFSLFSIPIDLAVGVSGSGFQPYASIGIAATIPAWW